VTPHAKNVTASESSRLEEEQRLLRALAQNTADLAWPSTNPVMVDLVERGLVAIIREYKAAWGGRDHRVAVLKITDAGREAMTSPSPILNHSRGSV
jgi:hypothetical protein